MAEKASREEFRELLREPLANRARLRELLEVDGLRSVPFGPALRPNFDRVEEPRSLADLGDALDLAFLNAKERRAREILYLQRASNPARVRVVAEGDSWFQYPVILEDVVDRLSGRDDLAVRCVSAGGDTLANMLAGFEGEVGHAVRRERPRFCILSAGGNDALGGGDLRLSLEPFAAGRPPEAYPNARHAALERRVTEDYERLLSRLLAADPGFTVILHGYDYAIPREGAEAGPWLGEPMRRLGIEDPDLQRRIVRALVDRFNAILAGLAARLGARVRHLDLRGAVGDANWHDELHPDPSGFRSVAKRFADAIDAAMAPVGG